MLPVLCPRASGNMIFICLCSDSPEPNVKMQKEVGPFFLPLNELLWYLSSEWKTISIQIERNKFRSVTRTYLAHIWHHLEKATVDFSRTITKTILFLFFFLITGGWTKGIRLLDWGTKLLPLFLLSWDDYLKVQINHPSLPPLRNSGALEI